MRLLTLLAFMSSGAAVAADRPARVVFPDVTAQDTRSKDAASLLSSIVTGELVRSGRALIGLGELKKRQLAVESVLGCPSTACRDIAARLEADFVLLVSAATLGKQVGVELKVLDPATSRVLGAKTLVAPNDSQLAAATQSALAAVLESVPLRISLKEVAVPVPVEVPVVTEPVKPIEPPSGPSRLPGIFVLGGGAVAAATGAVLVVTALSFNEQKPTLTFNEAVVARESAQTRLVLGYGLLAAGAIAAGLGTYLLVSQPAQPTVTAVVTPDGAAVTLSGHF